MRVPRQAIRREGDRSYAAVLTRGGEGFRWQLLEVGLIGQIHAEILRGLEPGDRVIADPFQLPSPPAPSRTDVAFRTAAEWRAALAGLGFEVTVAPMGDGTPFANVLFVARRVASAQSPSAA